MYMCTYVYVYVHACMCICVCICNRLPWQLGLSPTISRGMGGAMVQIINQTGSANPLQVIFARNFGRTITDV